MTSIAAKIGCTAQPLNGWVKKAEDDSGVRGGVPAEIAERLKALERENRELRQANEILRKASAYFDGVDAPPGGIAKVALIGPSGADKGATSMPQATIVGVDLAKRVFQLHGAAADGSVLFRKKLNRERFLSFLASQPSCTVAMEACATALGWGREIERIRHTVQLIPPSLRKAFREAAEELRGGRRSHRGGSIAADNALRRREERGAAGAGNAVSNARPTRPPRARLINALRGHLAEYEVVAAQGPAHVKRLADAIAENESGLPIAVRELGQLLLEQIAALDVKTGDLDKPLHDAAKREGTTKRLQAMLGVGPLTAIAVETFAPPMDVFRRGRDFATWLGLVPIQRSTGGKPRPGGLNDLGSV